MAKTLKGLSLLEAMARNPKFVGPEAEVTPLEIVHSNVAIVHGDAEKWPSCVFLMRCYIGGI